MAWTRKARAGREAPSADLDLNSQEPDYVNRGLGGTSLPPWSAAVAVLLVVSCVAAVGVAAGGGAPSALTSALDPSAKPSAGTLATDSQVLPTGTLAASSAVRSPSPPWQYSSPAATSSSTAAPSVNDLTQVPASGTAAPTPPQSPVATRQATTAPPTVEPSSAPVPTATSSGTVPTAAAPTPTVGSTTSAPSSAPVSSSPPAAPTPTSTRSTATPTPAPSPTPTPSPTHSPAGTTVPPPPSGWSTLFSDTFDGQAGSAPSTANWFYDIGTGFGNNEVQQTTNSTSNTYLDGSGDLVLQANQSNGSWTSAQLETTRDDFTAPPGGKLEMTASIQQPDVANQLGYWPAFWALGAPMRSGASWPNSGEIDMIEDVNGLDEAGQTFHFGHSSQLGTGLLPCPDTTSTCQAGFHTYTVIIDRTNTSAETLQFQIDGKAEATYTEGQVGTATWQAAVDHGFFILLDLAMGGTGPDGQCHCTTPTSATTSGGTMRVGYVAVYQHPGS